MTKKKVFIAVAVLAAVVAAVLLFFAIWQFPSFRQKGSFAVDPEVELAILRHQALKSEKLPDDATEEEIRNAVNGRLKRLVCIHTGSVVKSLAKDQTTEQIISDSVSYYYCLFDRIQNVGMDGKINWTEDEYYCEVHEDGTVYTVQVYPTWKQFYDYAEDPYRVFSPFTRIREIRCMDEYQGMDGTYIYYDTTDGEWVLYWVKDQMYLLPLSVFRQACTDAVAYFNAQTEQNGYTSGIPTPWTYLTSYRREDLDLAVKVTPEEPEKEDSMGWVAICLWEVAIGAVLFTAVILTKRYLRSRVLLRCEDGAAVGDGAEDALDDSRELSDEPTGDADAQEPSTDAEPTDTEETADR